MTLFIACLIIHGQHMPWAWYVGAAGVWVASQAVAPAYKDRFNQIDNKLRGIHSATLNGSCHYTGCKAVCKASGR